MFLGHYAAGFASKSFDRQLSLGTLFIAAQWNDLVWPVMLLAGIEKVRINPGDTAVTPLEFTHYPFSHGMLSVLIWGALFGGIYFIITNNARGGLLLAALVMSHWVLDWIVHRPDLPLIPGSGLKTGLGLWNSIPGTVLFEGTLFIGGVFLYRKSTTSLNPKGELGLWSLVLFLIIIYLLNLFGPAPPSVEPVAYTGLAQWIFIAWAYWIDANRISALVKKV